MNETLKEAIKLLLSESIIVLSWGITNIRISKKSLSFNVEGFKYKGSIRIKEADHTTLLVRTSYSTFKCDTNNLIEILDLFIERTEQYEEDLALWIDKKSKIHY